ncbi:PAS domain-containing protein [Salinibacter ruber]|uniref:PAS domain-containing protein n=1 Tax=Salinibacter ruber TaxID=146919 RepID=UPI002169999D|nr:PAS domain-containing protein [Salinibacter ruber]
MQSSSSSDDSKTSPHSEGEVLQVLLVEDNPGDARLFKEYLAEGPVEASLQHEETLEDCLEALREGRTQNERPGNERSGNERPRDQEPDVLALDLGLPDSDGIETVKAAVAAAPAVPIVVLTGRDDLQAALKAQEAGAMEYLQKEEITPALVGRTLRWSVQRRGMQAKLQQRDAWIRSITERLSAGVFRAGPTGRIEYANEALAEMLGAGQADQLIGKDLTGFYADPTDRGRILAKEGASEVEIEFGGQGGSGFVGLLSVTVAYDENGTVVHYDGTVTDITGRVRRKKQLRMLSKAVEQAAESVIITEARPLNEPGPRVQYVNSAHEEMTGYSEAEMIGETPRVLQGPKTDRDVLDSLREALEAGEKWQGETINYRKDGEPYRVQWNVAPVRGKDGEIEHWVSVQRDVTEQKEREQELVEAKREAQRMNQLKSAFLANMSHEIRTPLTSILGFAEAIGEEAGSAGEPEETHLPEEVDLAALRWFSSLIERSGHRLMNTLTGVLNLSKLQAGEMNLDLKPVDLAAEAEEVARELRPRAEKNGIDLKAETGDGPVWARADAGGLQIALRNLLSNAIKYTEEGEVRVRARRAENMAAVEVEDTGIGMDSETAQELFEAFKQASEGVGREYEGTGLGLTVTKEVLDQMGGSIEVETEKGEGSRFTVRLPVAGQAEGA